MEELVGNDEVDNFAVEPDNSKYSGYAKSWFLTYPKCNMELDAFKRQLDMVVLNLFSALIDKYIICKELHQDGSLHIHVAMRLSKRIRFQARMFDITDKDKVFSGHYQIIRNWKASLFYCTKENNFITNVNLFENHIKHVKNYSKINNLVINTNLHDLVKRGKISISQFYPLKKAKIVYLSTDPDRERIIKRRCYWIYGDPGIGKSYLVRFAFPNVYIKPIGKWWDNYEMETEVLMEDFDKETCTLQELKLWADQYADINCEIKGGMCKPNYNVLIVTSNYCIDYCFPWNQDSAANEAIRRRFKEIHYESRNQFDEIVKELKESPTLVSIPLEETVE
jgi:hypothetical protein